MMKIFEIVRMQLRLNFQSKSSIFFYLIMPVIFTFLFSMTEDEPEKMTLYIADLDNSFYSQTVISMVEKTGLYDIKPTSYEEVNDHIANEDGVLAGFVIPKGFGISISQKLVPDLKVISVTETASAGTEYIFISAINKLRQSVIIADMTSGILRNYEDMNVVSSWREKVIVDSLAQWDAPMAETHFSYADKSMSVNKTGNQSSAGYLAFFLCYAMVLGAGGLLIEKENGTLKRLLTVSVTKNQILTGKFLGTFFLGLVQIVIMVAFGSLVVKVNWLLHPFWISILLLTYLFALVSLGMLLSGLVKTHSQLNAIGILLIVGTGMLGGTWWPLEIAPVWMQHVAKIVPQSWFMTSAINLLGNSFNIPNILKSVGVLIGMGLTSILISTRLVSIKKLID